MSERDTGACVRCGRSMAISEDFQLQLPEFIYSGDCPVCPDCRTPKEMREFASIYRGAAERTARESVTLAADSKRFADEAEAIEARMAERLGTVAAISGELEPRAP